jgi:hypothetical protein
MDDDDIKIIVVLSYVCNVSPILGVLLSNTAMHSPYIPVHTEMFVHSTDEHHGITALCPVAVFQSRAQAVLFLLTLPTALLVLFLSLCLR